MTNIDKHAQKRLNNARVSHCWTKNGKIEIVKTLAGLGGDVLVSDSQIAMPLVVEDSVLDRRLRRPADIARAAFALLAITGVGLLAYVAHQTTSGIDQDISIGANRLPAALIFLANLVSGFSVLVFPGLASIDLLVRRRARQLVEAFGGLFLTALVLTLASWLLVRFGSNRLLVSFSGTTNLDKANPFNVLLGGFSSFITVSRMMSRNRWNVLSTVVVSSIALASVISGGITAAGLAVSLLSGWSVGLLIRYLLGTDTTRPAGRDIARTLVALGHPLKILRASEVIQSGRRYDATTIDGQRLELIVLDRDLEGAGLGAVLYRSLRLRDDPGGTGTSMRARLERMTLNSWAISSAGISTPHLLSVAEVGPDAAVLAYEYVQGKQFDTIQHALGDAELAGCWEIVRDLQAARIAHRALSSENFLLGADGRVYIVGLEDAAIAASDVLLRIDLAEALVTLSLLADPNRAIAAGRAILGDAGLARALPALQPVALSSRTRKQVKANKDLLSNLRAKLLKLLPAGATTEAIEIERIKPRTLLTIAAGTIAGYILLTQLGQVNLPELIRETNPVWMLVGFGFSCMTYFAATMTLIGVVPERLSFWKTLQTQLAASFATLVAPPTLGSVAINVRYLNKQRLPSSLAGASVAVAQVLAFLSHLILLLIMIIAAGTSKDFTFKPSRTAILVAISIALIASALSTIPKIRTLVTERVQPFIGQVVPRITSLANNPGKLATGIVGVLLLNLAYCACLVASVRAFTSEGSIAAISLVYLAGAVLGQAAPTPGGLGAVEAAIAAGLTASGIDAGVAVSATLVFRLWTFWIPTIPGWFAFQRLQKSGDL